MVRRTSVRADALPFHVGTTATPGGRVAPGVAVATGPVVTEVFNLVTTRHRPVAARWALLADRELVPKHGLLKAVLVVADTRGHEVNRAWRVERHDRRLVGNRAIGPRPERPRVRRAAALGGERAVDL